MLEKIVEFVRNEFQNLFFFFEEIEELMKNRGRIIYKHDVLECLKESVSHVSD